MFVWVNKNGQECVWEISEGQLVHNKSQVKSKLFSNNNNDIVI